MNDSSSECDLAVAVTTRDNIRTIEATVRSVLGLASHVLVVDSGSTDGTVEQCEQLGAEVVHRAWEGHARQKQFAIDQCRTRTWVLLLDSDEALEPELREAIREAVTRNDPAYDGWLLNRKVWFLGRWLNYTYQPQWRLRLVRGGKGRMAGVDDPDLAYPENLHERLEVPGPVGRLVGVCRHDPWADIPDMVRRQLRYAEIAAASADRGGSTANLIVNPLAALFKQLVLKRGFRDGPRGFIVAGLEFNRAMLKHALIAARRITGKDGPD
ncbi:MAG: glycosyltransferase family 2 protein [Planctomycetota bacterium]|jgi:glycosyltransferase involved in cell wall biosynthesis